MKLTIREMILILIYLYKQMTVSTAIAVGVVPYITTDLILSILVALTAVRVVPILEKMVIISLNSNIVYPMRKVRTPYLI